MWALARFGYVNYDSSFRGDWKVVEFQAAIENCCQGQDASFGKKFYSGIEDMVFVRSLFFFWKFLYYFRESSGGDEDAGGGICVHDIQNNFWDFWKVRTGVSSRESAKISDLSLDENKRPLGLSKGWLTGRWFNRLRLIL